MGNKSYNFTREDMETMCTEYFNRLVSALSDTYEMVKSCNQDFSAYLVPNGTANEISYSSKPAKSFRISNHWNWYANLNKCANPNYIQCLSVDAPWALPRKYEGGASKDLVWICQVSAIGSDGKYHAIFGEKFDRKTKTYSWIDTDIKTVIATYC